MGYNGFAHLAGGLAGGLSGLAAGMAIGIVGDAGVRATAQQPRLFVGMILILIFAEALGLYGLIIALIMSGKNSPARRKLAVCTLSQWRVGVGCDLRTETYITTFSLLGRHFGPRLAILNVCSRNGRSSL